MNKKKRYKKRILKYNMNTIIYDFGIMHLLSFLFYELLTYYHIESIFLGNLGFNLTRSVICGSLAYTSYINLNKIYNDKCLLKDKFNNFIMIVDLDEKMDLFSHKGFVSCFKTKHKWSVCSATQKDFYYDIFVMAYQVYKNINKKIRYDLLFHHILAIFVLNLIDYNKMYNITILIGLSEGMSFVSGFKLISHKLNEIKMKKIFIYIRLLYLIFIRLIFLWPSLILFYNDITNECDKFKNNKNITLLLFLLSMIIYNEFKWIQSGLKEIKRI